MLAIYVQRTHFFRRYYPYTYEQVFILFFIVFGSGNSLNSNVNGELMRTYGFASSYLLVFENL